MLRFLYSAALRAHPRYFRDRFAEEMQAIFDQTDSPFVHAGLLADAAVSLLRQRMLRAEFWERPAATEADRGALLFSSLGDSKPRTVALFYGAILSALVLNGVSLTIGYAWEHPIFIEIRQPVIVPPAAWRARPRLQPVPSAPAEPSLYTDQGRVLLIFNSPSHPASSAQPAKPASQAAPAAEPVETNPSTANTAVDTPAGVLASYAGTYVTQSPAGQRVRVTIDRGRLDLEVVGEFRSLLAPLPNPQLLACDVGDCWVMFSTSAKGTVERIEVHHLGREILAIREQRGMVF
ncbi:MAG TPA: hypothetical protein VLL05_08860 [Terriglobales bacterium]|nr:hypothetical protein [Terriglobales bacterium]